MPIVLFSRRGCHLCEQVEEWLAFSGTAVEVVDVDQDAETAARYGDLVPVIAIDGVTVLSGRFEEADLVAVIRRG